LPNNHWEARHSFRQELGLNALAETQKPIASGVTSAQNG